MGRKPQDAFRHVERVHNPTARDVYGDAGEEIVVRDLQIKGWSVFPHASRGESVDMYASKRGKTIGIEVSTQVFQLDFRHCSGGAHGIDDHKVARVRAFEAVEGLEGFHAIVDGQAGEIFYISQRALMTKRDAFDPKLGEISFPISVPHPIRGNIQHWISLYLLRTLDERGSVFRGRLMEDDSARLIENWRTKRTQRKLAYVRQQERAEVARITKHFMRLRNKKNPRQVDLGLT